MSTVRHASPASTTASSNFLDGIQYFGEPWPGFERHRSAVIAPEQKAVHDAHDPGAIYQALLGADALRYLTLQITGSKASGHPGGFASSAEAYSSLVMLGHTNIVTEVGHHAPGYYSAMFLDTSLEVMGINTVAQLRDRFRERHGLLGHLSGAIPGILSPAGPLGQGQHFAMSGALLHPGTLFPVTIGDGGMGEPYVLNSMLHFHVAYPQVTNFLPVLIWNGYSQEHHSMVANFSNEEMVRYWKGHGFEEVVLVDARSFDDQNQDGAYVDSTRFSFAQRLAWAGAVLEATDRAAKSALGGRLTALVVKQLKGAGVHALGAKAHNLYAQHTLEHIDVADGLKRRALSADSWQIVRENFSRAGGGPAARTAVTESVLALVTLGNLPIKEYPLGESAVPSTAFGVLVAEVGLRDKRFVVTNADGNEASGMANVNMALKIRHPNADVLYHQTPTGQVYEPLNEDACAGLAAGLALFGSRSLWLSYESFAINGLPIIQTVTQAMAELRRKTPSVIMMFTAGALEQGRNGWTHQRPEIEAYFAALMRTGNVFPVFPVDANMIQVAYDWALGSFNKGIAIFASKSPLPVRTTVEQSRRALRDGAIVLYQSEIGSGPLIVFAVAGDMVFLPVFEAKEQLEHTGYRVRIVAVVNPRRLYRLHDVAWESCAEPDDGFLNEAGFHALFGGDVLIGVTGGASAVLEPVLLRTSSSRREILSWKRGDTVASPKELMEINHLSADAIAARANELLAR
ncbi:MAG: phosphoketolase family protein [Acidiferrobacterales bacterium]